MEWNEDDRSEYEGENSSDNQSGVEGSPASTSVTFKLAKKLKRTVAKFDKRYCKNEQQLAGQAKQLSQMEGTLAAILTSLTELSAKSKQEKRHSRKYSDSFSADFGEDLTLTSTRRSSQFKGRDVIEEESEIEDKPCDNPKDEDKKGDDKNKSPIKKVPNEKEGFPKRPTKQRVNKTPNRRRGDPSDPSDSSSSDSSDDSSEDEYRNKRDRRKKKVSRRNDNSYSRSRRYSSFDTTMPSQYKNCMREQLRQTPMMDLATLDTLH